VGDHGALQLPRREAGHGGRRFVRETKYVTLAERPLGLAVDTATDHVGFRCIVRAPAPAG
jgi:hypothetical protein